MIGFVLFLLTALEVIAALLLIGIILIQQSKSGGGLTAMGGGMTETVFGASAGNVLVKGTVVLASIFLGATLLLAVITGRVAPGRSVGETLAAEQPAAEAVTGGEEAAEVEPAEADADTAGAVEETPTAGADDEDSGE